MSTFNDGLTQQQALALIAETTSARNLLGYGVRALRHSEFLETSIDPVMTMLSIGVEKLQKMALGLINVADHREWPAHARFKNHWRHDLSLMDGELMAALQTRLPFATHVAVVEPALLKVEQDPVRVPLIGALSRYGKSGRFYNLDALAEAPQTDDRPDAYWDLAENAAIESTPELKALFDASIRDYQAHYTAFAHALNVRLADTIQWWWDLACLAGKHRMLGERGASWAWEVDPSMVGRQ